MDNPPHNWPFPTFKGVILPKPKPTPFKEEKPEPAPTAPF